MEQNNVTLEKEQVWALNSDILMEIKKELAEKHPEVSKYELDAFMWRVLTCRTQAILHTLTNTAYENIIKTVREKLNLDELFENRQKYLN